MNDHLTKTFTVLASAVDQGKTLKIIPFLRNQCSCDQSLVIDKTNIAWIESTDEKYFCCGKLHNISRVFFKSNATVPLSDAIRLINNTIKIENNLKLWKRHIKMAGQLLSPF